MAMSNEVRELKDQISELEKMVKSQAKKAGNGSTMVYLEDLANRTGHNVKEFVHDKSDQLHHLRDDAATRIAKRPLTSAAIAFGAGAVLTALLRR